ncbi:hypothetical protein V8E36_003315 [Tilletia maclaganii]
MQFSALFLASALLSLAPVATAAAAPASTGTYVTNTKCTTKYGTLSRPTPVSTTLRHNTTTVTSRSSTTITSTVSTRRPKSTVTSYASTTYTYTAYDTYTITETILKTTASPSTTVHVPTFSGFKFINPGTTAPAKRSLGEHLEGRATESYPHHEDQDDHAACETISTSATLTVTPTYHGDAYTTVTTTKTIQPTLYAACASSTKVPAKGNNFLTKWTNPDNSSEVHPIRIIEAAGEISYVVTVANGEDPVSCCNRCQENPQCGGSAFIPNLANSPYQCAHIIVTDVWGGTCGVYTAPSYPWPGFYSWDPTRPRLYNEYSTTNGTITISNGPCTPWFPIGPTNY